MLHLPVTELPRQAEMTTNWSPAPQHRGPASLLAFCRPKQMMQEIMKNAVNRKIILNKPQLLLFHCNIFFTMCTYESVLKLTITLK